VDEVFDVAVIGAGPAGTQAAISAAHQMRHVLILDAGPVSQRKGRAYWSKSVEFQDVPVFGGITGPKFVHALHDWLAVHPERTVILAGGRRPTGIRYQAAYVLRVTRAPDSHFAIEASTTPLPFKDGGSSTARLPTVTFRARRLIVASGFEDKWPDIEVDPSANRLYRRHKALFRFAGNRKGWHVCIRCDGHLHVDEQLAVLATGDYAWYAARGAQDFTDKVTILTNGRPLELSDERQAILKERNIPIIQEKIVAHVGKGTDLLGLRLEDGRELYFDGFLLDEGQTPNTGYLRKEDGWRLKVDSEGQLYVDEDGQVLDPDDCPIPGLYAAGDIVADQRNLIATAFGLGQNAGLAASDSLREW
jgi:thioredoxin reductase